MYLYYDTIKQLYIIHKFTGQSNNVRECIFYVLWLKSMHCLFLYYEIYIKSLLGILTLQKSLSWTIWIAYTFALNLMRIFLHYFEALSTKAIPLRRQRSYHFPTLLLKNLQEQPISGMIWKQIKIKRKITYTFQILYSYM